MTEAVRPPDTPAYAEAQSAQAIAADPAWSAWVAANAGSGKTKVLIDRVARLLLNGASPDSILCVTYTKAAANEMLGRLFERLGDWSVMDAEQLGDELGRLQGRAADNYSETDIKAARALFARALETPGGLRIETIHAFCSRVLRRFPLEAGVPPGFNEIEDNDANALWSEAVRDAVLGADPATLDAVAIEGGGHGAQAGLSALRANRSAIARFARAHHDPDPETALAQMTETLRDALGASNQPPADILKIAMGDDLPREELKAASLILRTGAKTDLASATALDVALNAAEPGAAWDAYRDLFATKAGAWRASNPYTKSCAGTALIPDLFQMKDGEGREVTRVKAVDAALKAAQALARTRALLKLGLPALEAYRRAKRARAALDFDDLITFTRILLQTSEAASWVLYKLDGGLNHVLLDEAQDTSPDQWDLINALTEEFFAGEGRERKQDPRTLFVVGDEKQSIYSFQGAAPEQFLSEQAALGARVTDLQTPNMAMSFRSSPEVLTFVDTAFDSDAFDGEAAFTVEPPPELDALRHTARREGQSGSVELWPVKAPPEKPETDPWDAPLDAARESSPKAVLAGDIARALKAMIEAGETVWAETAERDWTRRPMRAQDALILVRSRTGGLFDAIIRALKDEGLPVAGADRLVLSDHIGVQDCLNLIRFALLPEDDLTLAEILRGPFCGLVDDDAYLFPLAYDRGQASLWERLQACADPQVEMARVFCNGLVAARHLPAYDFLSCVLDQPVLDGETGWDRIGARLGTPARDPIEALLARAIVKEAAAPASLQTFLAAMDSDASEIKRDLAAPDGSVRVMTVHGAKGLQAPVVILPDTTSALKTSDRAIHLLDGGSPVWSPKSDADTEPVAMARAAEKTKDLREHRRLLYVALTRAQDRLIVAGAWTGRGQDGRGASAWHTTCENAMLRLGAVEDPATGILRYGEPPPRSKGNAQGSGNVDALPAWLKTPVADERTDIRAVAPTALLSGGAPIMPPHGPGRAARLARGRAIHALLQRLPSVAPERRDMAARAYLDALSDIDPDAREEMIRATQSVLDHPEFSDVFQPGGRAEATVIGAAPELGHDAVINGRVDRLVVTDKRVLIIDFKTDRPAPADETGVAETYLAQMAAYRAVLTRAYPGRSVDCALVWTDGPKLMRLSEDLMLAALNKAASAL